MQFSSRPPISRDRYPYRNKYDGSRWTDPGVDTRGNTVVYDPRPERGVHPQHNPTNPILAQWRRELTYNWLTLHESALEALDVDDWGGYSTVDDAEIIEHARKVTQRVAAFTKESA